MIEQIKSPADIKALDLAQLNSLCEEIRQFLITKVSKLADISVQIWELLS
jgi:deoxyxylulose-5-phosphate synthase